MNRNYLLSGILLTLVLFATGCGGNSDKTVMTAAQAQAAYSDVFSAFSNAAGAAGFARSAPISRLRSAEATAVEKAILNGARRSLPEESVSPDHRVLPDITLPSYTYKCPSGGTIVVNGSYTETTNSTSLNIVETINSCSDDGVTFSGDPNVALSEAESDNGTTTSLTVTVTGGFTVGSSSCTINVNVSASISDKTGSGTITDSGSVCGQSISSSETITI